MNFTNVFSGKIFKYFNKNSFLKKSERIRNVFITVFLTMIYCFSFGQSHYVNVHLWVGADDNGLNGPTQTQINDMIPNLKAPYLTHGIDLNVCVSYVSSTNLINNCQSFVTSQCEYNTPGAIDMLVVLQNVTPNCAQHGGAATILGKRGYGFYTPEGSVIIHELGHLLGLEHLYTDFGCFQLDANNDIVFVDGIAQTTGAGDFVADTPPAREETVNSASEFLAYNGCDIDWTAYTDECNVEFSADHDPTNIYYHNNMGNGVLPSGCTLQRALNFTDGQAERMKGFLDTEMFYVTSPSSYTCVKTIATDVTSPTTWQGLVCLNQPITITSDLIMDNVSLTATTEGEITVASGGSLTIRQSDLSAEDVCNTAWQGIIVNDGAVLEATDSNISHAFVGLSIHSTDVTTNVLTIHNCEEAIRIIDVGNVSDDPDQSSELNLSNVTASSPVSVINSTAYFLGCYFENDGIPGDLICDASAVFVFPSFEMPYRRCVFDDCSIFYQSGPRLMIDETAFITNNTSINVWQCDFFTTCQSYFTNGSGAMNLLKVEKADIFLNIFDGPNGGQDNAIHMVSGNYGDSPHPGQPPASFIRDNIFGDYNTQVNLSTDSDDLNIYCNDHESYNIAWEIHGKLKDQGTSSRSAQNVFNGGSGGDIVNTAQNFIYYYLLGEAAPYVNFNSIQLEEIQVNSAAACENMDQLIEDWNEFFDCHNEAPPGQESYVVCCECCAPPPPPTILDVEGRQIQQGDIANTVSGQMQQSDNTNIVSSRMQEVSAVNFNVYPNPAREYIHLSMPSMSVVLNIYDISGKIIHTQSSHENGLLKINITDLNDGIYNIVISDSNNNLINLTSFVKN